MGFTRSIASRLADRQSIALLIDSQADFELVNENLSASKTSGESGFMLLS